MVVVGCFCFGVFCFTYSSTPTNNKRPSSLIQNRHFFLFLSFFFLSFFSKTKKQKKKKKKENNQNNTERAKILPTFQIKKEIRRQKFGDTQRFPNSFGENGEFGKLKYVIMEMERGGERGREGERGGEGEGGRSLFVNGCNSDFRWRGIRRK